MQHMSTSAPNASLMCPGLASFWVFGIRESRRGGDSGVALRKEVDIEHAKIAGITVQITAGRSLDAANTDIGIVILTDTRIVHVNVQAT